MFWFKHCPRCTGDLFEDQDQYGPFITCMQCGFTKDVASQDGGLDCGHCGAGGGSGGSSF